MVSERRLKSWVKTHLKQTRSIIFILYISLGVILKDLSQSNYGLWKIRTEVNLLNYIIFRASCLDN